MKTRTIRPLRLPGVVSGGDVTGTPRFVTVDPATLLIDDTYQRHLSEASVALITRIVQDWSWRAFKPPVVVETEAGLHVVDGQHTATAAAMHPGVTEIPVMVVQAERAEDRADSFVRHNRDRLAVTSLQLHTARVAAGDAEALALQAACDAAGVRVLKVRPSGASIKAGDTMAIEVISRLLRKRGHAGTVTILKVAADGKAYVAAPLLRAIEAALYPEEGVAADPGDLATAIREDLAEAEREAKRYAAQHALQGWQALKVVLVARAKRGGRRGRRAAA